MKMDAFYNLLVKDVSSMESGMEIVEDREDVIVYCMANVEFRKYYLTYLKQIGNLLTFNCGSKLKQWIYGGV